ncbi:MAG: alpha/beta hydrolase fold domain-containing protein, partial [Dehalococcoidia bacterium]
PVLDFGTGTESYRLYGEGYGLNGNSMAYYGQCYLNDEAETRHPYAAPLQAEDLSGLPQAHVITAECDPLRDDGEAYARRLQEAGVSATCTRYEGMVHAFFGFSPRIRKTQEALEEAAAVLRKGLVG